MESQERPNDSAGSMNKALLSLYESRLPELNQQIKQCIEEYLWKEVSGPFLMKVEEEYLTAPTKILFVGRETYSWKNFLDGLNSSSDLMKLYHDVSFQEKPGSSPFWWFRRDFSRAFGIGENFKKATLWTNLSKIDVDKKRPKGKKFDHLMQAFISLLISEIEIVKPEVILIMTKDGYYNWHLNHYRWLMNDPFRSYDDARELERKPIVSSKIQQLIALDRLPTHTYQLSHPNTLRFKVGGYTQNADELINALADQINPQ